MLLLVGCSGAIGSRPDDSSVSAGAGGSDSGGDTSSGGASSTGSTSTSSGTSSGGGAAPPAIGPTAVDCTHKGSGTDYAVGPGQAYATPSDVPFESLVAGDTVRIFYKAGGYHDKLMIAGVGTSDQPIRVCGVAGPNGELPRIDGDGATTRPTLDFPFTGHQVRGLIIIGHAHDAPYAQTPSYIVLEGLEITGASPEHQFTDKSGATATYSDPAAGVFVQRAAHLVIRGCDIHDNNNGIFSGTGGGEELTTDLLIESNHIHSNGSLTDYYEHNVYNEVSGVVYQFNWMGSPRAGNAGAVLGANIKDRGAGVVIRYNFMEDGAHMLDLVDAQEAQGTTVPMQSFHETFVYGNVFVRGPAFSGSMIHYGGDSGITENYRKGTLYFFQNTVVVENAQYDDYEAAAIFELSTNDEHLVSRNNVYFTAAPTTATKPVVLLGPRDSVTSGIASLSHDWLRDGITPYKQISGDWQGEVDGFATTGSDPGFSDPAAEEFAPEAGSALADAGMVLSGEIPAGHEVVFQYAKVQSGEPRDDTSAPTLGAFHK